MHLQHKQLRQPPKLNIVLLHADVAETQAIRQEYANVVPAAGSVVDLLVRAKNKETGQPFKMYQIVAQVACWCLFSLPSCLTARIPRLTGALGV